MWIIHRLLKGNWEPPLSYETIVSIVAVQNRRAIITTDWSIYEAYPTDHDYSFSVRKIASL